jgi:hypothetical protein
MQADVLDMARPISAKYWFQMGLLRMHDNPVLTQSRFCTASFNGNNKPQTEN